MRAFSFLQRLLCLLLLLLVNSSCEKLSDDVYPDAGTPPAFPGQQWQQVQDVTTYGWSKARLADARDYAEDIGSHAVMVIDQGRLIAAWGNTKDEYYVASVRKSFLSALYGKYVADGTISLDATLAQYNIDDVSPTLNAAEKQARVRDLLTSTSGVYHPAAAADGDQDPARGSHAPGTFFFYNNWDFNALGTIFEQRTGQSIYQSYADQIATPIGMEDFNYQTDGRYVRIPESQHPAYHFDMSARDMARFGLLMLRRGQWDGRQLLSPAWLAESQGQKIDFAAFPGGQELGGYGYMWWTDALTKAGLTQGGDFSAQGTYSQGIFMLPGRDLVIVHRGKVSPLRRISGPEVYALLQKILAAKNP